MPLPTSAPNAGINATLQPLQPGAPVATASNLQLLDEAFKQGLITADDIKNRLTIKPLQDKVAVAQANDNLNQLSTAPIQRQQQMSAADQQASLRDLQIQEAQNEVVNSPTTYDQQRRLREAQITSANQDNTFKPKKETTDLALGQENLVAAKQKNASAPAMGKAQLEDLEAQAAQRKAEAAAATAKAAGTTNPAAEIFNQDRLENTVQDIDKAIDTTKGFSSGQIASLYRAGKSHVAGSQEYAFQKNLESLKSKIALAQLAEIKQDSAKGGTGFGRITQTEYNDLKNSVDALDMNLPPDQLAKNLQEVKARVLKQASKQAAAKAGADTTIGPPVAPSAAVGTQGAASAPTGVPEISSDADFSALPVGAQFRRPGDPSGRIWTKHAPAASPVQGPPVAPSPVAASLPTSAPAGATFSNPASKSPHRLLWESIMNHLAGNPPPQ